MKNSKAEIYKKEEVNFNEFATDFLYTSLKQIENASGANINVALSGGNTPLPILESLKRKPLSWNRYNFFMVDERCVPVESDLSNFGNISKVFFNEISSKKFSMVIEGMSFSESIEIYESEIISHVKKINRSFPQFDLILLGMGDDGHTASLFPETEGLCEENKIVIINKIPQLNTKRITLTYPVIMNADQIIVIVKGKNKENIITEIYSGISKDYPIERIINQHTNLKWLIT